MPHLKYEGDCKAEGIVFPVEWEVLPDGRVQNIKPPELERQLYGSVYLAHVNHRNLTEHGSTMRVPTPVDVRRCQVIERVQEAVEEVLQKEPAEAGL